MSPRIYVLAAVCAALGAALLLGRAEPGAPTGAEFTLPALDELDGVVVERPGAPEVVLARDGEAWWVRAPVEGPAAADVVAALGRALGTPLAMDHEAPLPDAERGRYGLGGAGVVVRLKRGEADLVRFRIGKVVPGQRTFIALTEAARGGRVDRVYRARANLGRLFDRAVDEWRERRLFRTSAADLARLESTRAGELRWRAVREAPERPWRFEVPAEVEAGEAEVGGVAHAFATLRADAFVPADPSFAPLLRLEAVTFDGERLGVELAPRADGSALARRVGETALVRLPAHLVPFLDQGPERLRDRRVFGDFGAAEIRAAVVDDGRTQLRLVRDEDHRWRLEAPVLINPAPPEKVMPFLELVAGLETAGFPPDVPEDAFAAPAFHVELRLIDDRVVTLTVGSEYRTGARYARTSLRPERTCVLGPGALKALRPGPDDFRPAAPPASP